jgi:hypothetical protein
VSGEQFRYLPQKGPAEPIATAALIAPNAEGRFAYIGGTLRRIPTWQAYMEMAFVAWFALALVDIVLYAPFWIIGGCFKQRRRPAERSMRLWPLLAVLSLFAFAGIFVASSSDMLNRLGSLSVYSIGLFVTTLLFAIFSLAAASALWQARNQPIRRFVRWFSTFVTLALLIAAVYLAWWGVIGIRTWS